MHTQRTKSLSLCQLPRVLLHNARHSIAYQLFADALYKSDTIKARQTARTHGLLHRTHYSTAPTLILFHGSLIKLPLAHSQHDSVSAAFGFRAPRCRVQYRTRTHTQGAAHSTLGLPQVIPFTTLATRHSNTNLLAVASLSDQTQHNGCSRYKKQKTTEIGTLTATINNHATRGLLTNSGAHWCYHSVKTSDAPFSQGYMQKTPTLVASICDRSNNTQAAERTLIN